MLKMRHEAFFLRHPVFTGDEFAEHLLSGAHNGPRTKESILAYHTRTGRIVRIRRGLYAVAPPGTRGDSIAIDPYLIASRLARDSVLSHHTALQFHGRAYTIWQQFTYQATRPAAPLRFRSNDFHGTKFPSALVSRCAQMYDVLTMERANVSLRVASLERTMVDVMNSPAYSGGWEEVWRSLESVEFFDLDRVVEYALLLDNATTVARVGFFLEQHRDALMVGETHLAMLRRRRPRRAHYLDRARRGGKMVPEWNLVVPQDVMDRSWAEVA